VLGATPIIIVELLTVTWSYIMIAIFRTWWLRASFDAFFEIHRQNKRRRAGRSVIRHSIRPMVEGLEDRVTPTMISLTTSADDTLYQDPMGNLSNGAGQHFYVGDTNQQANDIRRGAIKFDLSGIPAGSTITSATLTLNMSLTPGAAGAQMIELHRSLKDWGEGASNAALAGRGGEGVGIQAQTGDVTWVYTFYKTTKWTTPGGDFATTASASKSVNAAGKYQWTGTGLIADLQQWLDHPATNFGWILLGNESSHFTVKQFDTKENTTPGNRPKLTIDYTAPTLPTVHFLVNAPAAATLGAPVNVTVTALDQANNPTGASYTGTVHFSSSDGAASLPIDQKLTNGTGVFAISFNSLGAQTVAASDTVDAGITGSSSAITVTAVATQFGVSAPANVTAGGAFLVTVTAQDGSGHTAAGYSGTVHLTSTDTSAVLPPDAALTHGVGSFLVTLKTVAGNPWTITATDTAHPITGASAPIAVSAGPSSFFTVAVPVTATTGSPVPITVTAKDAYGNIATGYTGHVHFTSTDSAAGLPTDAPLTNGVGTFQVTLNTAGNQTVTATDNAATQPISTGSSTAITTRGLVVSSFTPAADGFTAVFSKAFDPSKLTLYGSGLATVPDVTLVGAHSGPITGTLYVDPSNQRITFKATESFLESFLSTPVLPDDTYTVTLVSGTTNGFGDGSAGLDGTNNAGHANYTTTFTTANQSKAILSLPDFARGPDAAHNIQIPNDNGHGIPVTLTNATTVSAAAFTLNYNPALLTVTGASSADATGGGTLTLVGTPTIIDAAHAAANFQYTSTTPQTGTVVLGDIIASVPNSAASNYKAKELLTLTSITINGTAFAGVATSAVHVNAYVGDVTGNGSIDALDVATANSLAQGNSTGFNSYALLDPAIIGDVAGDISVDAGDVSTMAAFVSQLPTPKIPVIPTGLAITPVGPDPTLSLAAPSGVSPRSLHNGGTVPISVQLDDPHPAGSTGMTEAVLALTYDPTLLSISAADITLGSIPSRGAGWRLQATVDQTNGRIGIILYSAMPIATADAGSLVNLDFHEVDVARALARRPKLAALATVNLVPRALVNGREYTTQVDDAQGQFVLSPGVDEVLVQAGADSPLNAGRGTSALIRKKSARV
jgi:hypothetical protein